MREATHPDYHKVTAVCVCGGTIETGSTMSEIRLDICSHCHPFYTGTQKLIDTEGRVDKFKKRYANAAPNAAKKPAPAVQEAAPKAKKEQAPVAVAEEAPVAVAEAAEHATEQATEEQA